MAEPDTLERLQTAIGLFRQERFKLAMAELEGLDDPTALGLRLASEGALSSSQGRSDAAMPVMEEALAAGSYSPDVFAFLARFFAQHHRPLLAQHAFMLADTLAPRSQARFVADLPETERGRYAPWFLRHSDAARLELLDALLPYKHALVERLGADGAGVTLAGMVTPPEQGIARRRELTPLAEYVDRHGDDVRTLSRGGMTMTAPVSIFGADPTGRVEREARRVFTARLDDVVVTARSDFLISRDALLLDVTRAELDRHAADFMLDPVIAAADDETLVVIERLDRGPLRQVPEAVSLCGARSADFETWMLESLPRIWALMDVSGFGRIPILIDARLPDRHREAMRLLLGEDHPLIVVRPGERVLVEQLWVSSSPTYRPLGPTVEWQGQTTGGLDAELFRALRQRVRGSLERVEVADPATDLLLARRRGSRLTNATDIEAELERRGFATADPDDLTFRELLGLVRGAHRIVAVGEAASMLVFAERGLRLTVLGSPCVSELDRIMQTGAAMEAEITAVIGETAASDAEDCRKGAYRIDVDQLRAHLDADSPADTQLGSVSAS